MVRREEPAAAVPIRTWALLYALRAWAADRQRERRRHGHRAILRAQHRPAPRNGRRAGLCVARRWWMGSAEAARGLPQSRSRARPLADGERDDLSAPAR